MNTSERWLRGWVDTADDLDTIADRLTMAGLEVDAIEPASPPLEGIVIGRIESCTPHPQADRLRLCEVDVGQPDFLGIVCGAPNAAVGLKAPVATVGSVLPDGTRIKAAKLRGEASKGMLCGASELGFVDAVDGLWALEDDAPVGEPLAMYLGLPDAILDIDLTPNRGDCLSMRGIAREVAVGAGRALVEPIFDAPAVTSDIQRAVIIDASDDCPGYAAQSVTGICPGAPTPVWLRERLRRAGVRQINLPVDIGNHVMLELGQPMHAFDGDKLKGHIRVRRAVSGENIVTLDGEQVTLADNTLVIADDAGPVAIAGMIGGQRTSVDEHTTHVVFEAACFNPAVVAGRGRQYKIHTDSLHRFERGVDPELHPVALRRATGLLLTLGGGAAGPVVADTGRPVWPQTRRIPLSAAHIERLLGQPIPNGVIEASLQHLGMTIEPGDAGCWAVMPPSWRFDINIEADLIEEIARVYGYERLQGEDARVTLPPVNPDTVAWDIDSVDATLRERGYNEAITYSFVEPELHRVFCDRAKAVALDNPISDQYAEMRTTLWASLLPAWHYNVRRQQAVVRLYERGLRFEADESAENGIAQIETIAGVISGLADDAHWGREARPVDFFDLKGDVEALFPDAGNTLEYVAESHPALHPGRSARLYIDGRPVGWLGQLAPSLNKNFKNRNMPYVFEVDYQETKRNTDVVFEAVSEQPLVRRDLALIVPENTPAASVIAAIRSSESNVLKTIEVFDVFRGDGLETGFKSVALGLIFQDKASTLTDDRVETIITRALAAAARQCGARIRGE